MAWPRAAPSATSGPPGSPRLTHGGASLHPHDLCGLVSPSSSDAFADTHFRTRCACSHSCRTCSRTRRLPVALRVALLGRVLELGRLLGVLLVRRCSFALALLETHLPKRSLVSIRAVHLGESRGDQSDAAPCTPWRRSCARSAPPAPPRRRSCARTPRSCGTAYGTPHEWRPCSPEASCIRPLRRACQHYLGSAWRRLPPQSEGKGQANGYGDLLHVA